MASADVKVEIDVPAVELVINSSDSTRNIINKLSGEVAARANYMATEITGIWHETGKPHTPGKTGGTWHDHGKEYDTIGGKRAEYASKPAIRGKSGLVGMVYTGNYAAMKDNNKHNTMLKAL